MDLHPPTNFAQVPFAVYADKRLGKLDHIVFGVLCKYANKERECWPKRETISKHTGIHITKISKATSRLVKFGWLEKVGKGGYSQAVKYRIVIPDMEQTTHPKTGTVVVSSTLPKTATVDQTTVAKTATVDTQTTVAKTATTTVAKTATRNKKTIENTITPLPPRGKTPKKQKQPARSRPRFKPPTVDEVAAYCRQRKNRVDAERFVDSYTAKGWMIGKNKMQDWKACVRTWEKNSSTMPNKNQPADNYPTRKKEDIYDLIS